MYRHGDLVNYGRIFNWSDITPICELITEVDFNTDFDLITDFGGFHRTLQRVWLANRGRLLLRTPGPVPNSHLGLAFVPMLRPFFPELVISTDLLSFEHPSVLLFCFISSGSKIVRRLYRRLWYRQYDLSYWSSRGQ